MISLSSSHSLIHALMDKGTLWWFLNEHVLSIEKEEYTDGEKSGVFHKAILIEKDLSGQTSNVINQVNISTQDM